QILQVDAVHTVPGGVVQEPDGTPDDLLIQGGDMGEQGGRGPEQRGAQLFGGEGALVPGLLVFGQVVDQLDQGGHILGDRTADRGAGHRANSSAGTRLWPRTVAAPWS